MRLLSPAFTVRNITVIDRRSEQREITLLRNEKQLFRCSASAELTLIRVLLVTEFLPKSLRIPVYTEASF